MTIGKRPGGKKMEGNEKLVNLVTFHIRGRLLGGTNKCCIRGCTEEASWRKITCLSGIYELKITPDMLSQTNDLPIYICNQRRRGHKPKKLYSSVKNAKKLFKKSQDKLERDYSNALSGIKTCSSCQKNIVTKAKPCSKHTLTVSSKSYMCASNCLDETNEGKIQELDSDLFTCNSISNNKEMLAGSDSELLKDFICTECRPLAYLKLLKAEKGKKSDIASQQPNTPPLKQLQKQQIEPRNASKPVLFYISFFKSIFWTRF